MELAAGFNPAKTKCQQNLEKIREAESFFEYLVTEAACFHWETACPAKIETAINYNAYAQTYAHVSWCTAL